MKILVFGRGYPTKEKPRNGNFEVTQARVLKAQGHEVVYGSIRRTTLRKPGRAGLYYHDDYGVPAYELCSIIPYGRLPQWMIHFFGRWQFRKLYKIIEEKHGRPDIVHSHYLKGSSMAVTLKKKFHLPFIITEHWSYLNRDKISPIIKLYGKRAYRNADLVIAVSEALKKRIKQHFGVESRVINNMVDKSFFEKPEKKSNGSYFSFISVGNLIPRKGYDVLLKAFKEAFGGDENVKLKIVGDGLIKKDLEKLTKSLDISEQVVFTGQKTSREIRELLAESDAFALASRAETFGVVFIEALAQGLPVIGTRCGGPEEFVDESNGIVVEVDDVEALSKAMRVVYENHESYDSEKIARQCEEKFSEERIAEKLIFEYKKVLQPKKK